MNLQTTGRTDNMWAEAYLDKDARYCAITVLRGDHYTQDNSTMYTFKGVHYGFSCVDIHQKI
jgi:hypothetical protein